jgi:hypothetical protein
MVTVTLSLYLLIQKPEAQLPLLLERVGVRRIK